MSNEFIRPAPGYSAGSGYPMIIAHQVFDRGIECTGEVICKTPLRAGTTAKHLDIVLVGAGKNTSEVKAASGAGIALSLLCADKEGGEYKEAGPLITITAPADGITAEPGECLARFPIGNLPNPWIKVKLVFTGAFTGGKLDCALSITP